MDNFNVKRMKKIKFVSTILIGFIILCFIGYVIHERENVFTGLLYLLVLLYYVL